MSLSSFAGSLYGSVFQSKCLGLLARCGMLLPRRCASSEALRAGEISKLLVANRGEIACRVITSAKLLGIPTVAVYSDADSRAPHVKLADESYCIGGAAAKDSYLRSDRLLDVAARAGATAIHPGYGFLSESAAFAEACEAAGVAFVGPPAAAIRSMGDKSAAKAIMEAARVPLVPGYHGSEQGEGWLKERALALGMPVLIKPVAGGGGKGMKIVEEPGGLEAAIQSAKREAASSFGDERLLVERYVRRCRHVEVQVFADKHGNAVYLFDRDCSVQRRHQKILEEAPAPGLPPDFQRHIGEAAVRAALAVGYCNAGTVEFIVDCETNEFYFMEMNTRLQVEHPVTEAVTGVDLVAWQLHVAAGGKLPLRQEQLQCKGHAVEVRLYAENPHHNFLPGAGRVQRWHVPAHAQSFTHTAPLRVDSGVGEGDEVGINYDPMIAKIITRGADRQEALDNMAKALAQTQVCGLPTNLRFLQRLVSHPALLPAELDTGFIQHHAAALLQPLPPSREATALAAVAFLKDQVQQTQQAAGAPPGPWAIPDAKRLWSKHRQALTFAADELQEPMQVEVTYLSATDFSVKLQGQQADGEGAGEEVQLRNVRHQSTSASDHKLEAEVGGKLLRCNFCSFVQGNDRVLALWLAGTGHEFRFAVPSWSKDATSVATHGRVVAPMTGRVVKVLVSEGQEVAAGDAVLVLEAMKMEHVVAAPVGGTVRQLRVHPGGQVQDGQQVMVIQEPGGEEEGGDGARKEAA